jgi:O-antigen/teichoic acid export membrane protein
MDQQTVTTRVPELDRLAVGAGVGLAGRIGGRFISVLSGIIAARVLGPTAFGMYAVGLTLFRLIELIAPLGFDVGVIRYGMGMLGRDQAALKGIVSRSLIYASVFSVGVGVCLFAFSPWLARAVFLKPDIQPVLRLFAVAVPLSAWVGVLAAVSRLTRNMVYSVAIQDLGQPLLSLSFLGLFLWTTGLTLRRLVVADLLSYGLGAVGGAIFLFVLFPFLFRQNVPSTPPDSGYYAFSFAAGWVALLGAFVFWVDRLFAGSMLSATEVGYYQSASQISVVFAVIISGFNRILMPFFSSLYHDRKMEQLEGLYRVGTKWTIYIGLPLLLVLFLMPGDVLALIYGSAYSAGAAAFVVLLAGQMVNLMTGSIGPLLLAGGHQRAVALLSVFVVGVNALTCLLLIPRWGIVGAAAANALSVALLNISGLLLARRRMNVWPYDWRYMKILGIAIAAMLTVVLFRHFVPLSGILGLVAVTAVTMGVVGLGLVFVRPDTEDRLLLRLVLERFRKAGRAKET